MAERSSDLSWDYNETPDMENTPLLAKMHDTRRRQSSRVDGDVALSREQVQRLLQCFQDSAALLRNNLCPDRGSVGGDSLYSRAALRPPPSPFTSALNACANWILLWTVLLQAASVLLNSMIDFKLGDTGDAGKCIVVVSVCSSCGNFILWTTIFGKVVRDISNRDYSLWQTVSVYTSGMLVFAGLFMATFSVQKSAWKFVDNTSDADNYVTYYGEFLFYSVNIGTLHGYQNLYPTQWYTKLVTTIQMLISTSQLCLTLILGVHCIQHRVGNHLPKDIDDAGDVHNEAQNSQDRSYFFEESVGVIGSPGFRSSANIYGSCGMIYQNYTRSNSSASLPPANGADK